MNDVGPGQASLVWYNKQGQPFGKPKYWQIMDPGERFTCIAARSDVFIDGVRPEERRRLYDELVKAGYEVQSLVQSPEGATMRVKLHEDTPESRAYWKTFEIVGADDERFRLD
jgi:hypothetical protein